ncbi:DUF6232 family protein [Photobacterium alginatilyticum]|uniref:DUF3487 domain-containing protein n=1 Tax=Photobacterium alginatilyticum TaxID=1775171 RepID=A0ABW9YL68_9GAMM|nr:DUF6232 family protein [Photobacterium alginatilyticum]NBI54266.1 hypothetical protein [Photobacterium alginatilyticum]
MYKEQDIYLKDNTLTVKKDVYPLSKILTIEAKELRLKDQLIRILCISLAVSAVGWAFLPIVGPVLMLIGALFAVLTSKKYELRAEFSGTDESGDHWAPLARGRRAEEFALFKTIAESIDR